MDMRAVYAIEAEVEGEHLDLVKDPETTASAIKGAVTNTLPFLIIRKVTVKKAKARCKA
ncbi:MAG: hypothetical protein ABC527_06830 [Candidatus Methanosuratincola petrocarbonis]